MTKNNRKCIVCGKVYPYCPTCSDYSKMPPWHTLFCEDNCRKIFNITSDFLAEAISATEAKTKFDECNLQDKLAFNDNVTKAIETVYREDSKKSSPVAPAIGKPDIKKSDVEDIITEDFSTHKSRKFKK